MRNKYILLRHGQTIYQARGWNVFYPDDNIVSLTKKGKRQIRIAAKKLKNKNIDFIYSSDFLRTRQTAEIVAEELGLRIKLDKRLRDVDVGVYKGKKGEEFWSIFSSKKQRFSKRPPKGESWRDVKKRLKNFIKDIEKKHRNRTILIVTHADPVWLLAGYFKGLTEEELLKKRYIGPGGLWPDVGQFILCQ